MSTIIFAAPTTPSAYPPRDPPTEPSTPLTLQTYVCRQPQPYILTPVLHTNVIPDSPPSTSPLPDPTIEYYFCN